AQDPEESPASGSGALSDPFAGAGAGAGVGAGAGAEADDAEASTSAVPGEAAPDELAAGGGVDGGSGDAAGEGSAAQAPVTGPAASVGAAPNPKKISGWVEGPAYRGTGLMVTSALVAGVGLVQQAISYSLLGGTCGVAQENIMTLKTFDGQEIPIEEGTQLAAGAALFGLACVGAAGPALTMRMQTPLYLGASVGLAGAGGLARGRSNAYDDAFVHRRDRSRRAWLFRVIGGSLVGGGVFLWGSSRLGLIGNRPGCATLNCLLAYDILTLQGSGAMTITGAAMLSSGLAYKRHHSRYVSVRELGATPFAGRSSFGLSLHGRF
ncbi:MAG: hypothetical protein KC486_32090, partial [Myxococcales bacterium]|nr:hypothetical protein [Myxococcales bacterium]